jgi:predicted nucleic acid-binding protein
LAAGFRASRPRALFLSAITVGEMERGIGRQRALHPVFAETLASWLEQTLDRFSDRILCIDTRIARRWGQLSARLGHDNANLLIAATALEHDLTVVTRNIRHFQPTGARVEDPFAELD